VRKSGTKTDVDNGWEEPKSGGQNRRLLREKGTAQEQGEAATEGTAQMSATS